MKSRIALLAGLVLGVAPALAQLHEESIEYNQGGTTLNITCKVLVCHGADDIYEPTPQVLGFQDEMSQAGVDWQMISYGGAVHSFTNPQSGNDNSKGAAYNERADRRSWQAMQTFFAEIFR